jgi:hypothetical protein
MVGNRVTLRLFGAAACVAIVACQQGPARESQSKAPTGKTTREGFSADAWHTWRGNDEMTDARPVMMGRLSLASGAAALLVVSCEHGEPSLMFTPSNTRLSPNHGNASELEIRIDHDALFDKSWYLTDDLTSAGGSYWARQLLPRMLTGDTMRIRYSRLDGSSEIARFGLRGLAAVRRRGDLTAR